VKIEVSNYDPLELQFTINNPSAYPVRVLKWGTPLEGVWTDMFDIVDERNNTLDYIGMMVRRGPAPIEEEYVTIPKLGSISASIDLGSNYEFLSAGKFTVALNLPMYSEVEYSTENTVLSVNLKKIPTRKPIHQLQGYTNCNANQISQTNTAVNAAYNGATRAYNCMNAQTCLSTGVTWFGTYTATNWNFDMSVYRSIQTRLNNYDFNGYCNPAGCGANVYGYVYPTDTTFTVYLCGMFWSGPAAERVNTIVHEMSHFRSLGGTQDYAYGQTNCRNLARTNPNNAARNADNVCYFSGAV